MAIARVNPAVLLDRFRFDIEPSGTIDGVNTTFTLAEKYVSGQVTLFLNGVKMAEGATSDYVEVESGGPTSGFDAFTFVGATPKPGDVIRVNYVTASV